MYVLLGQAILMELRETATVMASLPTAIAKGVKEGKPRVQAMAHHIHSNPEMAFEEVHSSEAAADSSLRVASQLNVAVVLPTAFTATVGSGDLKVALCVEYDALPNIGHACGHNLIAGASVAATLALRPHVDELGITLKAIGTPAEESGAARHFCWNGERLTVSALP